MTTKIARQYNLPHTDQYFIVSYSYVSIEDGGGSLCENCNAVITRCVTVRNQHGKLFTIGSDCAETLTSLNKSDLKEANEGIKKIMNFHKKYRELKAQTTDDHFPVILVVDKTKTATLFWASKKDFKGEPFIYLRFEGRQLKRTHLTEVFLMNNCDTPRSFIMKHPEFADNYTFKQYANL